MSDADNIVIREYQPGDEIQIIRLYNQEYKACKTIEEFEWEFLNNPLGQAIIVVAENKGDIIGVRTQLLIPLFYRGNQITSGKNECSIIHKDYRSKGIFVQLVEKCSSLAACHGVKLLWGFSYAVKPYQKSGYTVIGHTVHYFMIANPRGLMDLVLRSNLYQRRSMLVKKALLWISKFLGNATFSYCRLKFRDLIGKIEHKSKGTCLQNQRHSIYGGINTAM
jgi:GNAT superfamily N-acetyltransferase